MLHILLGTLVALIPFSDGLLVAADSRIVTYGTTRFTDDAEKILMPGQPPHTVVAVTGTGVVHYVPKGGHPTHENRVLDIAPEVLSFLQKRNLPLPALQVQEIADLCIAALEKLRQEHPRLIEQHVGREMFSVIVASYDPQTRTSYVALLVIRISKQGQIEPHGQTFSYSVDGPTTVLTVGRQRNNKTAYANSPAASALRFKPPLVGDVSQEQAAIAAKELIGAFSQAEETSPSLPSVAVIGGPVDIVVLGNDPQPKRLQ